MNTKLILKSFITIKTDVSKMFPSLVTYSLSKSSKDCLLADFLMGFNCDKSGILCDIGSFIFLGLSGTAGGKLFPFLKPLFRLGAATGRLHCCVKA